MLSISIFIHVRLGDYYSKKSYKKSYKKIFDIGLFKNEYYKKAFDICFNKFTDIQHVYILSNEIVKARDYLNFLDTFDINAHM